jgi:putative proteasome-type protease
VSANDVDFPIDVVLYRNGSFQMVETRYDKKHLESISEQWAEELKTALNRISNEWMDAAFNKIPIQNENA